jgi:hypothetical protein
MLGGENIFCQKCGTELPGEAQFCWKCGTPQQSGLQSAEEQWERCEITYERRGGIISDGIIFLAEAMGPKGRYCVGKANKYSQYAPFRDMPPDYENLSAVAAHRSLVDELLRKGWEQVDTRGTGWWQYRFRRRV